MEVEDMENLILALFGVFLVVMICLDIGMIISLARGGDERRMVIVWKSGTYTLLGSAGALVINIIECLVRSQEMSVNPFTQLCTMAIIYFILILYFRRKYGG